jgi:signal transduction histidine kinase
MYLDSMTNSPMMVLASATLPAWLLLAAVLARPLPGQSSTQTSEPIDIARQPFNDAANVLILWDVSMQLPYNTSGRLALEKAMYGATRRPITIFDETLDLERFPMPEEQQRLEDLIVDKYRGRSIDLVVAVGRSGLGTARRVRSSLDRRAGVDSIPIVYTLDEPGRPQNGSSPTGPGITGLVLTSSEMETGRRMRVLIPELRTVAVVGSLPEQVAGLTHELRQVIGAGVEFVPLVSLSPEALQVELDALPSPAAVFYYRVLRDSDGAGWAPIDYLRRIAVGSPVPIFSSFPGYLGEGIVGGALRDPTRHGDIVGRLTAELLNGALIDTIPPALASIYEDAYDWSVLQRYRLPTRRLAADVRIIRKPEQFWQQYPRITASGSLLLAALFLAVTLLFMNGRRLAQLSGERRRLAQHLLTVQDAERKRIARDLHDDVCQEMSAIAVELDLRESTTPVSLTGAMGRQGGAPTRSPIADRLRAVVERTREVSHGLHAGPYSHADFPHLLEREADTLYERHRIACTVRCDPRNLSLSSDVTTGAYRIVLEALQNVVKHASASRCSIDITRVGNLLKIAISDDGVGLAEASDGGLGVLSMRERAIILGGRLDLSSEPFQGTTVTLTLPLPQASTGHE